MVLVTRGFGCGELADIDSSEPGELGEGDAGWLFIKPMWPLGRTCCCCCGLCGEEGAKGEPLKAGLLCGEWRDMAELDGGGETAPGGAPCWYGLIGDDD